MGYTQNKNYIDKKDLEHFWVAEAINTKQDKTLSNEVAEALSGDGEEVRTLDDALLRLNEKAGTGGEPGFSPTVEVTKAGKVTTVTITDKAGVHTATINDGTDGQPGTNGQDGAKGDKGADGVSPTISAVRVSNGVQLTITDKNGSHSAVINDGIGDGSSVATFADVPSDGKSYLRQNGIWVEGATKAELAEIGSKVGELVMSQETQDSEYVTGICDKEGNLALAIDRDGHLFTKAFNSKNSGSGSNIEVAHDKSTNLYGVGDKNGNLIVVIDKDGNIRTPNFDSRVGGGGGAPFFRFKYLHWNIGHFAKGNTTSSTITADTYEQTKKAFRALFAQYNADICGFCEWSTKFYQNLTASNEILSQYANHYIAPTEAGYVGTSIHSTFKLESLTEIALGTGSVDNKAYEGVLTIGGKKIIFCECHLPWSSQSVHDIAQQILLDRYANEQYVVVGGDFNFFVGDASHTPYRDQYQTWKNAGYVSANCDYLGDILTSYNNVVNTNYLDSIFVKGGTILNTQVHQVTPEGKDKDNPQKADETLWDAVNLSDHFPVISDITFNL